MRLEGRAVRPLDSKSSVTDKVKEFLKSWCWCAVTLKANLPKVHVFFIASNGHGVIVPPQQLTGVISSLMFLGFFRGRTCSGDSSTSCMFLLRR
jgi:hypothetical protein